MRLGAIYGGPIRMIILRPVRVNDSLPIRGNQILRSKHTVRERAVRMITPLSTAVTGTMGHAPANRATAVVRALR